MMPGSKWCGFLLTARRLHQQVTMEPSDSGEASRRNEVGIDHSESFAHSKLKQCLYNLSQYLMEVPMLLSTPLPVASLIVLLIASLLASSTEAWHLQKAFAMMSLLNLRRVLSFVGPLLFTSALPGLAHAQFEFEPSTRLFPDSTRSDAGPSLSSDGRKLYFGRGNDIWTATRSSRFGLFEQAVNLGSTVNSSSRDSVPSISLDGLSLYFGSNRSGGLGDHDLYAATRATTNDDFGTPVNLGAEVNSSSLDTSPDISADGLTLLFQSPRPGGFGQFMDIYMATRLNTSDPFGAVENLGPTINSGDGAGNPGLSADGLSLFFATSDPTAGSQQVGFGGIDLWVSTRASSNESWGVPVNLGPNVNSPFNDDFVDVAWDGSSIVFASDRSGINQLYEAAVACPGDANTDGLFNSTDLVQVFQRGEYEDSVAGNSTWSDGDWNNDNEFDSGDLVAAFQTGKYEQLGVTSSVPEPTGLVLLLIGASVFACHRRKEPSR
jgi:hypothetical protein